MAASESSQRLAMTRVHSCVVLASVFLQPDVLAGGRVAAPRKVPSDVGDQQIFTCCNQSPHARE
jgi:hypothetical protein